MLLDSDTFEFEAWLVDKKYIYSLPLPDIFTFLSCITQNIVFSLKYVCYTFFLLSHLYFGFLIIELKTKYNSLINILKYVYMTHIEIKLQMTSTFIWGNIRMLKPILYKLIIL